MAADAAVFFGLWLQKPLQIAATKPSGPHLADALARFVELERPGPVLELGAGTGSLTRGLVRAGCPLERIIAIEQEPSFAAVLRRDFTGATVVEGNAARIGQYLAGQVERLSTVAGFYSLYTCLHARVPKGCLKDISENDDPSRSWAAARCSRLSWRPPCCCCTRTRENPPTTSAARTGGCNGCVNCRRCG